MATFKEALRRVYSDLVWRRAKVRITPAVEPTLAADPIFVIGMYRSGTTLLRYVLDSHSNLACPPESAFISQLDEMYNDERSIEGFTSLGFDQEHVLLRQRTFAAYFFEAYAKSHGKARWVDKSPIYVEHIDFIKKLFPTGRFLVLYRHPLDQVDSAVKRGTISAKELAPFVEAGKDEDARIVHARYWANKAEEIGAFMAVEDYPCHPFLYEEMCAEPVRVLKEVFQFIDEPWEDSVLDFNKKEHDKGNEDGRVSATQEFSVSKDNYKDWPEELQQQCWGIVEAAASPLGYKL